MGLSFRYGVVNSQEIRLPEEKEVIEAFLREYITSTPKKHSSVQSSIFESFMEGVTKLSPEEEDEFIEITEEIIKKIINDKDTSIKFYKDYKEGWESYTRFTGRYKSTSEEIKSMLIEFAENTTLYEVYSNSNDYLTMVGWSGLKFGRDMQKLPDFDFDSWYKDYNKKGIEVFSGETEIEYQVTKNNPKAFAEAFQGIMKSNKKATFSEFSEEELNIAKITLLNLPSTTVKATIKTLEPFIVYPAKDLEDYQQKQIDSKTKVIRDKKVYSGGWVTTSPTNKSTGSIMWGSGIAQDPVEVNINADSENNQLQRQGSGDLSLYSLTNSEAISIMFKDLMTEEFIVNSSIKDSTTSRKIDISDIIIDSIDEEGEIANTKGKSTKKSTKETLTGGGEEIDSVYLSKLEFKIKFPKMKPKKTAGKFQNKVDAIIEATKKITLVPKLYRLKVAEWDSIPYSQESPNASEEMKEHLDLLKERLRDLTKLGVEIKGEVEDESPSLEKDGSIKEE